MSEEFVLDDDLFSFEAKVQPVPESEDLGEKSLNDSEEIDQDTGLGEFNFKKPFPFHPHTE